MGALYAIRHPSADCFNCWWDGKRWSEGIDYAATFTTECDAINACPSYGIVVCDYGDPSEFERELDYWTPTR